MKKIIILLISFFGFLGTAQANFDNKFQSFSSYKEVAPFVSVTTVIDIPIDNSNQIQFAVYDKTADKLKSFSIKEKSSDVSSKFDVRSTVTGASLLIDNNPNTYVDFLLYPPLYKGQETLEFYSKEDLQLDRIKFDFVQNSNKYLAAQLSALVDNKDRVIVAPKVIENGYISFPKVKSNHFSLSIFYNQPIRISDIHFLGDNVSGNPSLRFLAEPNHVYRVYFDADRFTEMSLPESGNLGDAKNIKIIQNLASIKNQFFTLADIDSDGIPDVKDNCQNTQNKGQEDLNKNGVGDLCEDFDVDYIDNSKDNCPNDYNIDQKDQDNDKIGDVCDDYDNRIAERMPWLPLVVIAFAIFLYLYFLLLY